MFTLCVRMLLVLALVLRALFPCIPMQACIQHTHITDDINEYIKAYLSPLPLFCIHSHPQFHMPLSTFFALLTRFSSLIHLFSYIIRDDTQCLDADFKYTHTHTRRWHKLKQQQWNWSKHTHRKNREC